MNPLKFRALAAIAATLLLTPCASASTLWFSNTPNPTGAPSNPTILVGPGQSFTIYLWAQMSANQSLTGFSQDIKASNAGVVFLAGTPATSYGIQNPDNGLGSRWSSTGTGVAAPVAPLLIDNAATANIPGSPMGFASPPTNDPTYNAASNSYLFATLNLVAGPAGSTNLFLGVGSGGIVWKSSPGGAFLAASTTINFGVGDAAIASNDSRRSASNAISTAPDATIQIVPEPTTLALIGIGTIGLWMVGARRRRAV